MSDVEAARVQMMNSPYVRVTRTKTTVLQLNKLYAPFFDATNRIFLHTFQ